MFKQASDVILPFLVSLFNYIFSTGFYPRSWSEAIIQLIHKKGPTGVPDNYRGISLLNICSKLYSYILNKRLSEWAEENNVFWGENKRALEEIIQQLITFLHYIH